MPLYELTEDALREIRTTTFADSKVRERQDLQRLIRDAIHVIDPDLMVLDEEFGGWEDSRRRIDLLCLDREAKLVVVELKRTEDGGHMELQAIRYAAMVSNMTFAAAVEAHADYLARTGHNGQEAEAAILEFLGWADPDDDLFAADVRIVLISAEFSREITSAVLWLNERDVDIRCVRLRPHAMDGKLVLDVQQIIPLPEAADYSVRLREKKREERQTRRSWSGIWFVNVGEGWEDPTRQWEKCRQYGYISAGGGRQWSDKLKPIRPGDGVMAYLTGKGYVGFGVVTEPQTPLWEYVPPGETKSVLDLLCPDGPKRERYADPDRGEYCVGVRWIKALDRENGVLRDRARRGTACKLRDADDVRALCDALGVSLDELREGDA